MHQKDVNKLIDDFKKGNDKAFDDIVKMHYNQTFNFLLKLSGNKIDSYDLCQETFIKVYKNLKKFKGKSKFSTWVYRIAYNVANTYFRKQKIRKFISLDFENFLSEDPTKSKEIDPYLMNAINSLPKKQKSILLFRIVEELPYKEISEIMRISINSAKVNYYYAISTLKKKVVKK